MASTSDEIESFDCEVCFRQFDETRKQPRTMSCGHTLCTDCINNVIRNGQITCPFCRKVFHANSAKDIPVTISLLKVMKTLKKRKLSSLKESMSSHVAMEPELNAGICNDHGSYKVFWCDKCKVWLCRDCTVLNHPTTNCIVMSAKKAFKELKKQENQHFHNTRAERDQHVDILHEYMSTLKTVMEHLKANIVIMEQKYDCINHRISTGNTINQETIKALTLLANAETIEELMSFRRKSTEQCQLMRDWTNHSKMQLLPYSALKLLTLSKTVITTALDMPQIRNASEVIIREAAMEKYITHMQIWTTVHKELIQKGLSAVCLDELSKLGTVWAVLENKNQSALVTQYKRRHRLHTLCNGTPPKHSLVLPYSDMKNLTSKSTAFITLGRGKKIVGTLCFKIDQECPDSGAFIRRLTGENDPLINVCVTNEYETYHGYGSIKEKSFYNGGRYGSVEDSLKTNNKSVNTSPAPSGDSSDQKTQIASSSGMVTLKQENGKIRFTIWYLEEGKRIPIKDSQQSMQKLGKVIDGMEVLRQVVNDGNSFFGSHQTTVIDCGLWG